MRVARWASIVALVATSMGCSRSKAPEPEPPPPAAPAPTVSAPPLSARYVRPMPERLVAIGDLHGDLDATRRALRLAGAIDEKDAWIGGKLVVVQTGDEIDRGDDDRKILDLFERLGREAAQAGGEVLALSGNHEVMNASLDFRYVTKGALHAFEDVPHGVSAHPAAAALEAEARGRAAAFLPGGRYATMIAARPIVARVGDTIFVHGGILPKHVRYGLDRINDETRDWLLGKRTSPPKIVASEDGPVWTRNYSAATGREECATLREVLASLGAARMVVGHTVQRDGINAACDEKVWRIDTGLAGFYGGKMEVLEVQGGKVTVRRAAP